MRTLANNIYRPLCISRVHACCSCPDAKPLQASKGTNAQERTEIQLTYLGNAGWQITDGKTIVLVDPYLTQFRHPPTPATTGQLTDPQTIIASDTEEIDGKIRRADYILVTHGHLDHALDAPYIAKKLAQRSSGTKRSSTWLAPMTWLMQSSSWFAEGRTMR
jgi:ribonuclease BN (tRNA processing enzyme)